MTDTSKIITLPNPHLRQPSGKVTLPDEQTDRLVQRMQAAVINWEASRNHEVGVALAAIQIDEARRVVVIRADPDDKTNQDFHVFINPEITRYEGEITEDYEGCLSVANIYGKVPRYAKVRVKAYSPSGKEFRVKAEGFLARVLQHEIDHTNGRIFIDLIKTKSNAFFKLTPEGKLEPLDYEKDIRNNSELWN